MKFKDRIYQGPHIKISQETGFKKYCNKIFFSLYHTSDNISMTIRTMDNNVKKIAQLNSHH